MVESSTSPLDIIVSVFVNDISVRDVFCCFFLIKSCVVEWLQLDIFPKDVWRWWWWSAVWRRSIINGVARSRDEVVGCRHGFGVCWRLMRTS